MIKINNEKTNKSERAHLVNSAIYIMINIHDVRLLIIVLAAFESASEQTSAAINHNYSCEPIIHPTTSLHLDR